MIDTLSQLSTVPGPAGDLEVGFRAGESAEAKNIAIICHPHPLHGGTMDNKVVTTLSRTYSKMGWHSLRFNFRGVGRSAGSYGHLNGEIEDLKAVVAYVRNQFPGAKICLAGFSFGAAVAANVATADSQITHLLLIAPPVGKYDLDFPDGFSCPVLVVQGGEDDIVDLPRTQAWAKSKKGDFKYCEMAGAEHFFHGKLTELAAVVVDNFHPGAAVL